MEPSSRLAINSSISSSDSGSSSTLVAFSLPPAQFGRLSRSSGRAMQREQDRSTSREIGDVLDELEEDRLAPLDVVEEADERLHNGIRLQQLAKRPGDLIRSGGRADVELAQHDLERVARGLVREDLSSAELLHDLHDRPVRDALPVRETPPLHHSYVAQRAEELVNEPRLAHARRAENREEVARARAHDVVEGVVEQLELARPADHWRSRRPGRVFGPYANRYQPVRNDRLGLALELERRQRLDRYQLAEQLDAFPARGGSRRVARPAPDEQRR